MSHSDRKPSIRLYIACVSAQMGSLLLGCALGWSGPALADMARPDSRPHLTNDSDEDRNQKSWIGSSMTLGALVGSIIGGLCMELIGRKKTLILLGIPNSAGYLLLCFGRQVWLLILGRIIVGMCTGVILCTVPTYIAEISTPNIRGLLGMAFNVFGVIGILYMDILGLWVNWNWLGLAAVVPSVLLSATMFFMPESPAWLMLKYGRTLRVVEAMHQLRDPSSDIDQELDELEDRGTHSGSSSASKTDGQHQQQQQSSGFSIRQLSRQDVYKPLAIGLMLCLFQQFSGSNALQFYMTDIFKDSGSTLRAEYATIVVNCSNFLATIIGSLAIDRFGRRLLLLFSGLGHTVSLAVLGYYYYANRNQVGGDSSASVLPIICMVIFFVAYSIGFCPVIWIVITEICTTAFVGFITTTCSVFVWLCVFVVTKEFEDMVQGIHKYGAYWFYGACSLLSILFVWFLPETKGKSIDDIQRQLYPKIYGTGSSSSSPSAHESTINSDINNDNINRFREVSNM
ncbi:facilitated trehalose transporter Tret1-2 homolog [Oppia nitens]|uniref:facilitated trehalose transporter Tret1-2 homolog n=1 Tax=Oppia nitens TaxID=1686743 RepID=UPI0023D9E492|nr:facilitated trehalose transporter Tret1-2 homolog [Oppia nitens]